MRTHPLILPALAVLAGIFSAWLFRPAWLPPAILAGLALVALIRQGGKTGRLAPWLLALCFLFLAMGRLAWLQESPTPGLELSRLADGGPHTLRGTAATAPEPTRWGQRQLLAVSRIDGRPVDGACRLDFGSGSKPPRPGRLIQLKAKLKPFVNFANPGGFDYKQFMAEKGVFARAYVGPKAGLQDLGPGRLPAWRLALARLRARAGALFDSLPPGAGRELLRALSLGQRAALPPEVRQSFAGTGTAHLLAISGLHLGLVWAAAYLILRLGLAAWPGLALRLAVPKLAALGAFLPCAAYALLAAGGAPTLRALVMAACLLAALFLDRPYRPAGALALAALVIGLAWPRQVMGVSFQLSFIAVGSILLVGAPLAAKLLEGRGASRLWLGLAGWLLVSAVVGLAVWPLSAHYFHQISFIFLPANALLVPLVGFLALPAALLGCFLGLLWPPAGAWLLSLALYPADWSLELAHYLAALPNAFMYLAGPGAWTTALIYAGLLGAAGLKGKKRLAALGLACVLVLAGGWLESRAPGPSGRLEAWVLDVGQGQSVVLRLPRGQVLVVDGGGFPGGGFDTGAQVVAPFLWSRGLDRVWALAASHGDQDHSGGLPFLARWFHPAQIWTNGRPPDRGGYGRLLAIARQRGLPVLGPARLARLRGLGGAKVRLLWPPAGGAPAGSNSNDRSLWLGLGLGECWLWLPGDVGPKVERRVTPSLPGTGQHVILAPHHGAKGSLSAALLDRLKPQAAIISSGCLNRFGLPRRSTVRRIRAHQVKLWQTALHGCIRLSSDGRTWRISPYLSHARNCPQARR